MPGILDLYAAHAEGHIQNHVKAGTKALISRKQVELEIIDGLDKNKFPIEIKVSWYHAILSTPLFETLWRSAAVRHKLSVASISRYQPKESLLELPSSDDLSFDFGASIGSGRTSGGRKRPQRKTPAKKRATTGLKTIPKPQQSPPPASVNASELNANNDDDDDDDDDDSSSSTSSTRAYAAAVGIGTSNQGNVPSYHSAGSTDMDHIDPHLLIDPNGLARQDDGDGEYGKRGRPRERTGSGARGGTGSEPKAKKRPAAKGKGKGKGKEVRFAV